MDRYVSNDREPRFERSAANDSPGRARRGTVALLVATVVVVLLVAGGVFALRTNEGVRESVAEFVENLPPPVPEITIPAGTPITISLDNALSSKTSSEGDRFTARVVAPVIVGGKQAIPGGARITGHVLHARSAGKASGRGRLQLAFEEVQFGGRSYALGSRSAMFESRSGADEDAAMIGGGAVAGGILGGILGQGADDAAKGIVIGGAAGTVASLLTRGPQIEFPAGTRIRFTLDQPVSVRGSRPS
jgi:hypothetical protein